MNKVLGIGIFFKILGIIFLVANLLYLGFIVLIIGATCLTKHAIDTKKHKETKSTQHNVSNNDKCISLSKKAKSYSENGSTTNLEQDTALIEYKEKYLTPEGKQVSYKRLVKTKVRGVYYNDIYDFEIDIDDKVAIVHNPTNEFPESTDIVLISSDTILGKLMKEMAEEFVSKYGNNFCFIGTIVDFELDDDTEENKISKILIQFEVPSFIKKKVNK